MEMLTDILKTFGYGFSAAFVLCAIVALLVAAIKFAPLFLIVPVLLGLIFCLGDFVRVWS